MFVCFYQALDKSKFNYNAIFALPICFILSYFWYNQLNFLKFSLRKNNVLTSKEYVVQCLFWIKLFIWWMNLIQNKAHIFYMNFDDFNILHMDLCGILCTPGQVLENSSLLGHKNIILLIFYTEHQMLI